MWSLCNIYNVEQKPGTTLELELLVGNLDRTIMFLLHGWFGNNGFYIPKAGGFLHPKGPKGDFLHPKGPKGPRDAKNLLLDPRDAKIHLLKG